MNCLTDKYYEGKPDKPNKPDKAKNAGSAGSGAVALALLVGVFVTCLSRPDGAWLAFRFGSRNGLFDFGLRWCCHLAFGS